MLRALLHPDTAIIDDWIAKDPDHSAKGMTHRFFLFGLSFAIEDERGPTMYVRLNPEHDAARIHIQFDNDEKRRTALALVREFQLVSDLIKKAGYKRLIFDSVSEPLVRFCQKRFGFVRLADSNDYIKEL
jgi:hypothetical protein